MTSVTLTWRTMHDDRVCPICKELDGKQWTFETGKDQFPPFLEYAGYGVVWNVADGSAAHTHGARGECRCHIETEFNFADLLQRITRIADKLEAAVNEGNQRGDAFNESG